MLVSNWYVLCRSWRSFCCLFPSHHHVQSAISLNFLSYHTPPLLYPSKGLIIKAKTWIEASMASYPGKCRITEFPLRVGLIRTPLTHWFSRSTYEHGMSPTQKFNSTALQTQWCNRNIRWNNLQFRYRAVTYVWWIAYVKASGWVHRIHELIKHGHTRSEVINFAYCIPSLVPPSLFLPPVFDCLQYAKMEGGGLGCLVICMTSGGAWSLPHKLHTNQPQATEQWAVLTLPFKHCGLEFSNKILWEGCQRFFVGQWLSTPPPPPPPT